MTRPAALVLEDGTVFGGTADAGSGEVEGMELREKILVLDFGSQYSQLIARRIRELGVYCRIVPHDISADEAARARPKALVLSGGPASAFLRHC